uniref:Uncharacterized protein n=1 Tax=Arundo donax TaxID=35708 RepID=A0A0A9BZA3_ARUDO
MVFSGLWMLSWHLEFCSTLLHQLKFFTSRILYRVLLWSAILQDLALGLFCIRAVDQWHILVSPLLLIMLS